mmetsp:Transcript_26698/g.60342  ORF Transcript_26698/g.60342 Transcript_26698/m.60342 type:complete len:288 (+) Transcript_26698:116-979(+)
MSRPPRGGQRLQFTPVARDGRESSGSEDKFAETRVKMQERSAGGGTGRGADRAKSPEETQRGNWDFNSVSGGIPNDPSAWWSITENDEDVWLGPTGVYIGTEDVAEPVENHRSSKKGRGKGAQASQDGYGKGGRKGKAGGRGNQQAQKEAARAEQKAREQAKKEEQKWKLKQSEEENKKGKGKGQQKGGGGKEQVWKVVEPIKVQPSPPPPPLQPKAAAKPAPKAAPEPPKPVETEDAPKIASLGASLVDGKKDRSDVDDDWRRGGGFVPPVKEGGGGKGRKRKGWR